MVNLEKRNILKKGLLGLATAAIGIQSAKAVITNIGTDRVTSNNATFNGTDLVPVMDASTAHIAASAPHSLHSLISEAQTITVGSGKDYATIQEALDSIGQVVRGFIDINVDAGTFTEALLIPAPRILSGGIRINGTLTSILSATATSGSGTSGASLGYVTKAAAGWVVDAYQHKLLYNVTSGKYATIVSNTSDTIYYWKDNSQFTPITTGDFIVYDFGTVITNTDNTIDLSANGKVLLNDIKVVNSGTSKACARSLEGGNIIFNRCLLDSAGYGVNLNGYSFVTHSDLIIKAPICVYAARSTLQYNVDLASTSLIIYNTGTSPYCNGIRYVLGAGGLLNWVYFDGNIKRAGGIALAVYQGSNVVLGFGNLNNWVTGMGAAPGGFIQSYLTYFAGNTTDKAPSGATDPAYIS